MIKRCCDICGQELDSYIDKDGKIWDSLITREKKGGKLKMLYGLGPESWWVYFEVCGKCRKAIAEYREKDNG